MTFFLLSDFPLSHALSSACSKAVLRAELDGDALDRMMLGVERMKLLRPRARTRCALVYNFHNEDREERQQTVKPQICRSAEQASYTSRRRPPSLSQVCYFANCPNKLWREGVASFTSSLESVLAMIPGSYFVRLTRGQPLADRRSSAGLVG